MANSPENVTPQGHSREFSAVRSKFTSILGNFKDDEDESHVPAADHATARDSDSDEDMEGLSSRRKKRLRSSVMKGPARLMLNRAEELFERDGDLAGCLEECRAVLTVHGDCERAHGLMAKCHAKLNDIPAALQSTKNIVKLNPNHYKAWSDYFSFAEQLKLTEEGMEALKGLVAVKTGDLSDEEKEDKLTHLNHLILLLESEEGKEDLVIGYQEQLLQLAENLPSVDVFGTAVALAEKYLASGRADRAEKLLEERLEFQLQKVGDQSVPLSILIHGTNIYTLSLSEKQDFKKIWKFCQRHRIVSRSAGAIIFPAAYLKRNSPHSTSLVATICLARLKMSPVDLPLLEWAITDILLVADTFAIGNRGKQYVDLCATLLLEVNAADIALKLLRYCQNILTGYSFRSAETCYLLGNIYEDLAASKKDHSVNYVDKARQAYQESLVFRPSYRDAKYRLCYLEGDFPTVLSFSLTPKRKKEHAAEQCTLYLAYLAAHVNGDSSAIVDAAKNCILSTFRFVLPPRPDDFIWCLNTPYALLTATKRKRASCQLLAMDDRGVRYWHQNVTPQAWLDMALTGCTVAYQEKRYDDMVEIAFYAILTAELHEPAAKTVVMDDKSSSLVRVSDRQWQLSRVHLAIAVAAFHMRPAWEMNDSDDRPTWTDRKAFFYDYIRVLVNRHGAMDLAVDLWNPFYALIMDEAVVPNIAVGKWGHFFTKKKGFSMHVQMILANDALRRRGAAYHAYTLYRGIEQSMGKHTPWQVYLGLGILAVNVACRFGMSRKLRAKFYASSMAYLMKYEQLRRSCPEVLYNKARAAQEFGDAAVAVGYYRQCIRLTDLTVCTGDGLELAGVAQLMDYKFRAAFNLRQLLVEKARFVEARALMTTGGPLSWKSFTDGKTAHSRC